MDNKCKAILTVMILLAIAAMSYLFYIKYQESKLGYISFSDIEREQKGGDFYLKNKKAGFLLKIPESWTIKNTDEAISFTSSNYEAKEGISLAIPQRGCWIASAVRILSQTSDIEYEEINSLLREDNFEGINLANNKYEIVFINNIKSLKESLFINNKDGEVIYQIVKTPYKNKIYYFETHLFGQEKDQCQKDFDNFLQAVSIEK